MQDRDRAGLAVPGTPPPFRLPASGRARPALRPPDRGDQPSAGGPVAFSSPVRMRVNVVVGPRTRVRRAIGCWQCGHSQPFTLKTLWRSSAQHSASSALLDRLHSCFESLSAALASCCAWVDVATLGTTCRRRAARNDDVFAAALTGWHETAAPSLTPPAAPTTQSAPASGPGPGPRPGHEIVEGAHVDAGGERRVSDEATHVHAEVLGHALDRGVAFGVHG